VAQAFLDDHKVTFIIASLRYLFGCDKGIPVSTSLPLPLFTAITVLAAQSADCISIIILINGLCSRSRNAKPSLSSSSQAI
jgi:hypothetical protein